MTTGHSRRIAVIAVGETLVWAGMFYSFPALLLHWEQSLGWSKTELSGAFTVSLLLSAGCAPLVGRLIDRGHGALVLGASALTGALLLVLLSRVGQLWQFYLVWMGLGVAMSGCLYEPCFAHLTHVLGIEARRSITTVTLIAGFAGTVSFPIAHFLSEAFGWRGAVIGLAALVGLAGAPMLWLGARFPKQDFGANRKSSTDATGALARALRAPVFWLLAGAFALTALNHGMLITHLLPLLADRGIAGPTSVLAASLIGPMQVVGRLAMMAVQSHLSMSAVCIVSFFFLVVASTLLYAVAAVPFFVFAFVLLQGSGYGVTSITRPVITVEFLGRAGFGVVSGAQATAYFGAAAAAPMVAALLWRIGGYDLVIIMCIAFALAGIACFAAAQRTHHREPLGR